MIQHDPASPTNRLKQLHEIADRLRSMRGQEWVEPVRFEEPSIEIMAQPELLRRTKEYAKAHPEIEFVVEKYRYPPGTAIEAIRLSFVGRFDIGLEVEFLPFSEACKEDFDINNPSKWMFSITDLQYATTRLDNGEPITGNLCQLKDGTFIMPQDVYGSCVLEYSYQGMGCGLEDRGIHDRYEAMRHGWDCGVEQLTEITPPLIAVAPATVRRSIDLGATQDRSTEELQAESTQLRNEGNYILDKQKILADIISQRLRDAAVATRPWKVGDTVEVLTERRGGWVTGICTAELSMSNCNTIAAMTKEGKAHKSNRLRPDRLERYYYRFEGKCYAFEWDRGQAGKYVEVQP